MARLHNRSKASGSLEGAVANATEGEGGLLRYAGAHNPLWQDTWVDFLKRWLARVGRVYDESGFAADQHAYREHFQVEGGEVFTFEFSQPISAFVRCQHSRATWTVATLGAGLT